ncbi:MAG: Dienelactone hydrolase family protein [Rhodanobacteraceae bacterium]|jgi:carboxymethylenebutenolidase|nr:MAG: Dienelactone hydrolase family protein [Rhodanobacteraceae bacterium]
MGERINLNTAGTHCIGAYLAKPSGKPKGGVIVVQEIFGVTAHIRDVADRFAKAGYTAVAPAFFDYVENDVELGYDRHGMDKGKDLAMEVGLDRAVEAVASAAESIRSSGKIGVVGYCWGGTVALLSAQRLALPAVSYYGARNVAYLDQPLKAPVIFHFGANDRSITAEAIEKHRKAWPDAPVYVYEHCGHAFNRDVDKSAYNEAAATLAWQRTLDFFGKQLAGA